jgi:hypothetical protein
MKTCFGEIDVIVNSPDIAEKFNDIIIDMVEFSICRSYLRKNKEYYKSDMVTKALNDGLVKIKDGKLSTKYSFSPLNNNYIPVCEWVINNSDIKEKTNATN